MSNSPKDRYGLVSGHPLYDMSLHGSAIRIYAILCLHANSSAECWPSIKTMATDLKVSIRYIQKCLDELMAKGYIRKSARYGQESGQQLSNAYFLPHYPARGGEQIVPRGANNMFMGEGELIVHGGDEHFVQGEGEQSVPGGMNNMFTQTQENTPANKPEEHMASPSAPAQTAFIQEPQPEPKKRSRSEKAKDFDLDNLQVPDWMPKETWQQYITHRKTMKKPMSVNSAETLIKQLGIAKQNGWSPENIMNSAISSGYQGCVFEKHLLPNPNQSAGNGNNGKPRILTRRDCDPGPIESYLHTELHDKYGQTGLQQIPKAA